MEFGIPVVVILLFLVFFILLVNTFRRSRTTPSMFMGVAAEAGDDQEDSWEGAFWEAQNPQTVSANLLINYVDGAGYASERAIRVCEFDNELYGGILIAHCQLRDAMRTFRFNRIASCRESGSEQSIADIAQYLNSLSKAQADRSSAVADATDP